ncbi:MULTISPECIES: hypothetical protein [unclassified Streptomyces]|uniref:hypothetical protein n=1 Tax=unclassified Streptomyces TaxID=2593676 RepID=UPI001BECA813|nr:MULTISPECIES: hypothetical protein [unclassified Streptomyces]MBT2408015.1 hypothetical protein [Streptomyces sp. ISL-21]MBT2611815.1 hypothetical protein [Streptomyces sp. ISL-87]
MANTTVRARQRSMAAAARAAAKRAEQASRRQEADLEPAAPEPADTMPAKPARSRPRRLTALLGIVVLLALTATATLAWKHREAERTTEARAAALTAARKAAPVILSYDYRHLDRDFAAARGHLTGPFLDQYSKTTETVVAPTAKTYSGVVKAAIATGDAAPAASVISASPNKAVVLLFMNQLTTSTQIATPRLDLNRVRMTLVRTPQGWKVSAVDAL